ncbi:hypothetical protein [Azospirillum sp. TSO5]|uniref:hypothetical protein n=1 Tax=Azospirillum sp. TSO5 TaxID=716760 RepID=UPI000D61B8C2|nr:hypothetical protein [Azospirillum sp. TSO5]PWC96918.1 hypothetical protein TSO5_05640 [Azospirillum sp. TSO5]
MTKPLYYAEGRNIHKRPIEEKTDTGTSITLGFRCAVADRIVGEEGAQTIAELMNRGEAAPSLLEALEKIAETCNDSADAKAIAAANIALQAIASARWER